MRLHMLLASLTILAPLALAIMAAPTLDPEAVQVAHDITDAFAALALHPATNHQGRDDSVARFHHLHNALKRWGCTMSEARTRNDYLAFACRHSMPVMAWMRLMDELQTHAPHGITIQGQVQSVVRNAQGHAAIWHDIDAPLPKYNRVDQLLAGRAVWTAPALRLEVTLSSSPAQA